MKPGKLDLPTIWRGCDWGPVILKWKDQSGTPLDVTYWQAVAQSLNINLNPSVTDGAGGVTQLSLTKVQTANLKLGLESWDWIWQRPLGEYRYPPFLAGKVEIKQPTSKSQGSLPPIGLPPDIPVAIAATQITSDSFTANWEAADRATGYRLDVSISQDFSSYVTGYQDRDVQNLTSFVVSGLEPDLRVNYHYRVRAYNSGGVTNNSNVIHVTLLQSSQPVNDNIAQLIVLQGLSGQLNGTNVGATTEVGEPQGENSVWYGWRPNIRAAVGIRVSTTLNRISVFRNDPNSPPGWGQLIHVADSVINAGTPLVVFVAGVGEGYFIRVYKATGTAPFTLSWDYGH